MTEKEENRMLGKIFNFWIKISLSILIFQEFDFIFFPDYYYVIFLKSEQLWELKMKRRIEKEIIISWNSFSY